MPGEMAEMFCGIGREEAYWEKPRLLTPLDYYARFPHTSNSFSSTSYYDDDDDDDDDAEDYGAISSDWDDI